MFACQRPALFRSLRLASSAPRALVSRSVRGPWLRARSSASPAPLVVAWLRAHRVLSVCFGFALGRSPRRFRSLRLGVALFARFVVPWLSLNIFSSSAVPDVFEAASPPCLGFVIVPVVSRPRAPWPRDCLFSLRFDRRRASSSSGVSCMEQLQDPGQSSRFGSDLVCTVHLRVANKACKLQA